MKAAGRALAAAGVLCLAGCSYIPFYQDAAKKPMPLAEFSATANLKVVWSASVGKGGDYRFPPRVDGKRVFAVSVDGTISLLDAENDRVLARIDSKRKISSSPGGQGDFVDVGTVKGEVVAFDPAGTEKWVANVGGEVLAPVAVAGQSVIARTDHDKPMGKPGRDPKHALLFG